MGLGYLTLATKSEQDKYLTGNPQFTFFKGVYKKHTNFATDYQYVNLIGDTNNSLGKKLYLELPKNGDLLHRAYLAVNVKEFVYELYKQFITECILNNNSILTNEQNIFTLTNLQEVKK